MGKEFVVEKAKEIPTRGGGRTPVGEDLAIFEKAKHEGPQRLHGFPDLMALNRTYQRLRKKAKKYGCRVLIRGNELYVVAAAERPPKKR